jgi:hypothetical protein
LGQDTAFWSSNHKRRSSYPDEGLNRHGNAVLLRCLKRRGVWPSEFNWTFRPGDRQEPRSERVTSLGLTIQSEDRLYDISIRGIPAADRSDSDQDAAMVEVRQLAQTLVYILIGEVG